MWRIIGCSILLGLVAVARLTAADPPRVDSTAIDQAKVHLSKGRFPEAEKLLRQVVAEMDAGRFPRTQLGTCLNLLTQTYRELGQSDKAIAAAERRHKVLVELTKKDTRFAPLTLSDNAALLADMLIAAGKLELAEDYLREASKALAPQAAGNPLRALTLDSRLARLAEARNDEATAKKLWKQTADRAAKLLAEATKTRQPAKAKVPFAQIIAAGHSAAGDFQQAQVAYRSLLDLQREADDQRGQVETLLALGNCAAELRQFDKSEEHLAAALMAERWRAKDSRIEADILLRLGALLKTGGRLAEAKAHFERSADLYRAASSDAQQAQSGPFATIEILGKWAAAEQQAGRLREAIDVNLRLLALREKQFGKRHPATFATISELGTLYGAVQDYDEALPRLAAAVEFWRAFSPAAPLQLAQALQGLGAVKRAVGSLAEAQTLLTECISLREKLLPADDLRLAYAKSNLASVFLNMGRYAEAASMYDEAKEIYLRRGDAARDGLSNTLLNLALVYQSQGQLDAAARYCAEALAVYQKAFGKDAAGNVSYYVALARLAIRQGQIDAADKHSVRAWELCGKHKLTSEPIAAMTLHQMATIEFLRKEYDAAERHWGEALKIQRASGQSAAAVRTINYLARVASLAGRMDQAESRYRRAAAMQLALRAYPTDLYLTNSNLAEVLYTKGEKQEAIRLLKQAVEAVETPRAETIGAEGERAEYFAQFASAFDLLVAWNLETGNADEAFAYAERGRNRTFLDQLRLAGVDLLETLQGEAGEKLRKREDTLRTRLGTLSAQAVAAEQASKPRGELEAIAKQFAAAQKDYAAVWTEIRSASPYYRRQLSQGSELGTLDEVHKRLTADKSAMLFYYLGERSSYLLVASPDESQPQVLPLVVSKEAAVELGIPAGPLTRKAAIDLVSQFIGTLRDANGRGIAGIVVAPRATEISQDGTQLADLLVPRELRSQLQRAATGGVVIVPDGALHQLPFEALLVGKEPQPRYMMDVLPSINYAPSATILVNLEDRPTKKLEASARLLTVGNPTYVTDGAKRPAVALAAVSRDAYIGLGGRLPPLPGTHIECEQVAKAFANANVTRLEAADATETKVRGAIGGTRYLHIAAHGLVDQKFGNLFGAIALTPPSGASVAPGDDGFLSLHEIHSMNLSGCELAVLSACQTNVGPDRPLEAGSTLAQAFLAGGAKRVVCSHWNVDDASTAELMGQFFKIVAEAQKKGTQPDYAAALHEAQMRVRSKPKWSKPFYWAPFVLVGPAR